METDKKIDEQVEAQIVAIETMSLAEVKTKWLELYGMPSPKGMSQKLMKRACIYQVQVLAYGGLSKETKRLLKEALPDRPRVKVPRSHRGLSLGTRLIRDWHGRTYVVEIVKDGFLFDGKVFASLSAIARHITGVRWNGRRFFGVKAAQSQRKAA